MTLMLEMEGGDAPCPVTAAACALAQAAVNDPQPWTPEQVLAKVSEELRKLTGISPCEGDPAK